MEGVSGGGRASGSPHHSLHTSAVRGFVLVALLQPKAPGSRVTPARWREVKGGLEWSVEFGGRWMGGVSMETAKLCSRHYLSRTTLVVSVTSCFSDRKIRFCNRLLKYNLWQF